MLLQIGDKIERWQAGKMEHLLEIEEVTDTTATLSLPNGSKVTFEREHDGGFLRNLDSMTFAGYIVKK